MLAKILAIRTLRDDTKNILPGNDEARYTDLQAMFKRVVEEPKTLLYWIYHPATLDPNERRLVPLDIEEKITFQNGHVVQKNSEYRVAFQK